MRLFCCAADALRVALPPSRCAFLGAAPAPHLRKEGISDENTHTCPKCGSTDLLRVGGSANAYGIGNNILAGRTIFSAVLVHRYVCCGCRYSEEWIDREDIPRLEKKYR